jgi:hypothetical protein
MPEVPKGFQGRIFFYQAIYDQPADEEHIGEIIRYRYVHGYSGLPQEIVRLSQAVKTFT